MDRDLDVLTVLLLDPCLTTNEATHEAAAHRRLRLSERAGGSAEKWPTDRLRPCRDRSDATRAT